MRALITGGLGFAGKFLLDHLLSQKDEVIVAFYPGAQEGHVPSGCEAGALDVTSLANCKKVISDFKPEVIYHLAALTFVPDAERDFAQALNVNVGGVYNVLRACDELSLSTRVLLVSSAEAYGKFISQDLPLREELPLRPMHNYGLSKAMSELVAERFSRGSTVKPLVVRAFNHIGPGQRGEFVVANFAHQFAQIAAGLKPPVLKVGNLEAKRDFTDVRDIIRAYRLVALKGSRTYNLCSGKAVAISTIVEKLREISGLDIKIELDPLRMRPSEVPEVRGSFEKAQHDLGWKPEISLDKSLRDIFEHCKKELR